MRKKTVGALAGAAAAAVALGSGGTFALWSDSDTIDAGTITAGNLEVETQGAFQWYDTTLNIDNFSVPPVCIPFLGCIPGWDFTLPTLRHDFAHPINDMDTYRVVPGDFIVGEQSIVLDLEGDNLRADLTIGPSTDYDGEFEGLTVRYGVYNETTNEWIVTSASFDDVVELEFQAPQAGQGAGTPDPGWPVLAHDTELTFVVLAEFDEATSGTTSTEASTALDNLVVELEQTRRSLP